MNEQPLNLRASLREIWRRRLLIIVVAVICGLGGALYGILRPPNPTAVALVLLPPNTASNSSTSANSGVAGNGINTDAVIARSTPVLAAAGAKVSPPLGAQAVKKLVTVTPLSGQLLQIQAQAPVSGDAVSLANAVAKSYIDYIDRLDLSSSGSEVAALQQEASQLSQQIKDLQTQIDTVTLRIAAEGAGSSAGQQDTTLLESFQSEQNQVAVQLNTVTSQIQSAELASGSAVSTTVVLQKAAAQPVSKYSLPIEAGAIGFVIGLLASVIFVLVRLQRGRRLRLRNEFAWAAGAPVIASLDAPGCSTPTEWREFLEEPLRATTQLALRHVLDCLPYGSRPAVRIISFAGDAPALTTGPRLAMQAASSGTTTALVPGGPNSPAERSLTSLRAAFTGARPVGEGLPFRIGVDDTDEDQGEFVVSLVLFDSKLANLTSSDALTLLSISPNFATADELAQLALAVADCGSLLDGVVVVNPEPTDNTTGLIGDDALRLLVNGPNGDGGDNERVGLAARTSNGSSSYLRPLAPGWRAGGRRSQRGR